MIASLFGLSRRELAVLVAAFVLSLPAVTPRIYASDEIEYFSYLRSLWFDRDLSFDNEYRYFYDRDIGRAEGFRETFLEAQTAAGRRPNFGTIGCALLWSPFYAVGDLVARSGRAMGYGVEADGYSRPYLAAVSYGSAVYGFLALLLSIGAARRVLAGAAEASPPVPAESAGAAVPGQPARVAAALTGWPGSPMLGGVLVWLGTPLLFYMYVAPPMSHACSAFAVALFVTIWLRVRRSWTVPQVLLLGAAAALMTMVREQDVFFAAGPALDFALGRLVFTQARGERLRAALTAAAGCAMFATALLPQLIAYARLNGHVSPSPVVARKMTWTAPHAADVIFSTSHGFLFWTPLAALAVAGLVTIAVRHAGPARQVALVSLLMVALQVYVGGSVESWTVAGAFGQRRFVALTVLLVIGLAGLLDAWPTAPAHPGLAPCWRGAAVAAVAICVWWNLGLMALFGTRLMDRQRIEIGRNAYDVFVTLPRLAPQLAYRYIADRDSFYRSEPLSRRP